MRGVKDEPSHRSSKIIEDFLMGQDSRGLGLEGSRSPLTMMGYLIFISKSLK